jgi:glycosyltransferase involved in cell wall biosynthesis
MDKNPTLTVLICVHSYNDFYDNLLLKSIESLEKQTYKEFDTLIILDECWEYTKIKIDKLNTNLKLIIKEKEKRNGLYDAKNFGLSFIKTELVSFLDADDLYVPQKLEKQINFFKNNEVDFLGTCRWEFFDDESILQDTYYNLELYEDHEHISLNIKDINMFTHGSMMIRKSCLDELGGYVDQRGSEDWELWNRAINNGYKFHQLPEKLYLYRCGTSNLR